MGGAFPGQGELGDIDEGEDAGDDEIPGTIIIQHHSNYQKFEYFVHTVPYYKYIHSHTMCVLYSDLLFIHYIYCINPFPTMHTPTHR